MIHPIDWLISKLFPTMIVDDYRWQWMGVFPSSQLATTEAKKVWALGPAVRIISDKTGRHYTLWAGWPQSNEAKPLKTNLCASDTTLEGGLYTPISQDESLTPPQKNTAERRCDDSIYSLWLFQRETCKTIGCRHYIDQGIASCHHPDRSTLAHCTPESCIVINGERSKKTYPSSKGRDRR